MGKTSKSVSKSHQIVPSTQYAGRGEAEVLRSLNLIAQTDPNLAMPADMIE